MAHLFNGDAHSVSPPALFGLGLHADNAAPFLDGLRICNLHPHPCIILSTAPLCKSNGEGLQGKFAGEEAKEVARRAQGG